MAENRTDGAAAAQGPSAPVAPSPSAPAKEHPLYVCEACGPDKPAAQVFQCTLCALNYCVNHLAPMAHYCFGALGKPQTIGVSG